MELGEQSCNTYVFHQVLKYCPSQHVHSLVYQIRWKQFVFERSNDIGSRDSLYNCLTLTLERWYLDQTIGQFLCLRNVPFVLESIPCDISKAEHIIPHQTDLMN